MRLLGALMVTAAGAALGLLKARELGRTAKRREELCWFLECLSCELEGLLSPLPELFATLSGRCGGEGKTLAGMVTEGFSSPERASFGAIWASALTGYPRREREILLRLGDVLGRGAVEMQLPVIALCRREMELSLREAAKHRREMSRVYIGLGTAGGMMLAVLLI